MTESEKETLLSFLVGMFVLASKPSKRFLATDSGKRSLGVRVLWQATWGRGCKFGVGSDVAAAVTESERETWFSFPVGMFVLASRSSISDFLAPIQAGNMGTGA